MAIHHLPYPDLEIGRTLAGDRVVVSRDDFAIAISCIQAMTRGFLFRLTILSGHDVRPADSFGFDRAPSGDGLDLALMQTRADGTHTAVDLQLQSGGGSGSRYNFDFWAPIEDTATEATIRLHWLSEDVPPTETIINTRDLRPSDAPTLRLSAEPITYP